jgi:3-deoxy-D-manno-octulosonic-acid transferase
VSRSELSRSATPPPADPDVLLVDTTGELRAFYACAAVVFVGKSLTAHGGQNPIEPAAAGKAMIVGPHMENFADVIQDLRRAEAVVQVRDAAGLTAELKRLLRDAAGRDALSERAAALVRARRGVIQRSVEIIARRLPP